MTKLTQWMFSIFLFLALWLAVIGGYSPFRISEEFLSFIYLLPIIIVVGFGVSSVAIIAYRVATFNNCDQAAIELIKEIDEAKRDLSAKGFQFR